jgi:hypothetical protein
MQKQKKDSVTVGAMLLGIAALHQVVGLAIGLGLDPKVKFNGPPPLRAMWADGVFASVGLDLDRIGISWFLLFGFALALVGLLVYGAWRALRNRGVPDACLRVLAGAVAAFGRPAPDTCG